MRRWMLLAALAMIVAGATPALHAQTGDEGEGPEWKWFGSLRIRPEYNDNLSDLFLGRDDKIGYVSYRVNLGTDVSLNRDVSVVVDVQGIGAAGEDLTVRRGLHTINTSESYFSLYRGYIQVKDLFGEQIDLRIGRQEIVMGDGFLLGNEPFYGGISWDALRGDFKMTHGTFTAFWAKVAELDHPEDYSDTGFGDPGGDFEFYGLYDAMTFNEVHHVDLALLYNFDHTPVEGGPAFQDKRITYHARYAYEPEARLFGSINAAWQSGDTLSSVPAVTFGIPTGPEVVDADAYGIEATFGYRWVKEGRRSQVFAKWAYYTGDDPESEQNETFNPLAQEVHNRYGFLDFWHGIWGKDPYVGGPAGFRAIQLGFETELSNGITLAAYAQRNLRGVEPAPEATNRNMGQEWGVLARYAYGDNLDLEFCYAQLFPGTANDNEPPYIGPPDSTNASTARRLYVGATARF